MRSPTTHACAYGSPIGFRLRPLGKVFWRRRPSVCAKSVHGDPSFHWHWLLLLLCAFYVDSLTQQPHRPRHQHGWGTGLHCIATECNYYENNWIQWGRLNTMWVRIHIIRGFNAIGRRRCNFTFIGMLHFCRWDHHSQVTVRQWVRGGVEGWMLGICHYHHVRRIWFVLGLGFWPSELSSSRTILSHFSYFELAAMIILTLYERPL